MLSDLASIDGLNLQPHLSSIDKDSARPAGRRVNKSQGLAMARLPSAIVRESAKLVKRLIVARLQQVDRCLKYGILQDSCRHFIGNDICRGRHYGEYLSSSNADVADGKVKDRPPLELFPEQDGRACLQVGSWWWCCSSRKDTSDPRRQSEAGGVLGVSAL